MSPGRWAGRRLVRTRGEGGVPRYGWLAADGRVRPLSGPPWAAHEGLPEAPLDPASLLAPVEPSKIVCVGRNYAAHAAELGNEVPAEPLLFLKPPSAVIGPGEPIHLPPGVGEVHHEAELAIVVGRRLGSGASRDEARAACFGLTCANDVTARTIQRREGKFTRAKGFDTFCPLGPWIVAGADPLAPRRVTCRVGAEVRQSATTEQMIFDPLRLLIFVASVMTLEPGDVLLTGTPPGVAPLRVGDRVEVEIEGVGRLENPVTGGQGGT